MKAKKKKWVDEGIGGKDQGSPSSQRRCSPLYSCGATEEGGGKKQAVKVD